MKLYCCQCAGEIQARLTDGAEIYPHRTDLSGLPFWKCDACGNHVGCHHKTKNPTRPLGNIPTKEIRKARQHIHRILDPIWKEGRLSRGKIYARLAEELGISAYHTGEIRDIEQARRVYRLELNIAREASAA